MANSAKDDFIAFLRDARAMESQGIELLEKQLERLDDHPESQARLAQHLRESEDQARVLDGVLERYGVERSVLKEAFAKVTGSIQGMVTAVSSDVAVKDAIAAYALESFEVANYTALIAAAEHLGDTPTAEQLKGILRQEEAMQAWCAQQLPRTTHAYLSRAEAEPRA